MQLVKQERAKELHCPPKPSVAEREAMAARDDGSFEEVPAKCPAWVAHVCRNREAFSEVAFVFGESMTAPTFALGHAYKSPFCAALYNLQRGPTLVAAASSSDPTVVAARRVYLHNWRVQRDAFFYEDSPCFADPPALVVPLLRSESNTIAWRDAVPLDYKVFIDQLPPPTKSHKQKKTKTEEVDHSLEAKHPWVRRFVGHECGPKVAASESFQRHQRWNLMGGGPCSSVLCRSSGAS